MPCVSWKETTMTTDCFLLITLQLIGKPVLATIMALLGRRHVSRRDWLAIAIAWPVCLAGWIMVAGRFWGAW